MNHSVQEFLAALADGIQQADLPGRRVVLAVSGGADSIALLRGMVELREEFGLELSAAHFDHRLRDDSIEVARWVERVCASFAVPLKVGAGDVLRAVDEGRSEGIEAAARRLRYGFLCAASRDVGATAVVVAHTLEDQAETILHQILRGTGLAGLRGMPFVRPLSMRSDEEASSNTTCASNVDPCWLARPMLNTTRASGRRFLEALGQDFRDDPMNQELRYTRARIRHSLLPQLATDYNPQVVAALNRLGAQAAEMQGGIEFAARELLHQATLHREAGSCRLARSVLRAAPRSIIRECFCQLWREQDWPRREMGYREWNRLADLVAESSPPLPSFPAERIPDESPRVQHFPGHFVVEVRADMLLIQRTREL